MSKKKIKNTKKPNFWARVWNVICWPFRKIAQLCKRFWNWVCNINFIGLLNTALLVVIIVLFSMLIMDFCRFSKTNIFKSSETETIKTTTQDLHANKKHINKQTYVNVVPVKTADAVFAKKHIAKQNNTLMGDTVINTRAGGRMLRSGMTVRGNLYLQDMNKYVLPCDIKIHGNLFLRDIGILQFCGKFSVSGNIYVTPTSSFGPIPRDAYVGGHVII